MSGTIADHSVRSTATSSETSAMRRRTTADPIRPRGVYLPPDAGICRAHLRRLGSGEGRLLGALDRTRGGRRRRLPGPGALRAAVELLDRLRGLVVARLERAHHALAARREADGAVDIRPAVRLVPFVAVADQAAVEERLHGDRGAGEPLGEVAHADVAAFCQPVHHGPLVSAEPGELVDVVGLRDRTQR